MLKESEKEWLDRTIKKVTDKIDKGKCTFPI